MPVLSAANLLLNPSFEDGTWVNESSIPDYWWKGGGGLAGVTLWKNDGGHTGSKYAAMEFSSSYGGRWWGQSVTGITAGTVYELSVWAKATGNMTQGNCNLLVDFRDASKALLRTDSRTIISGAPVADWTYYTLTTNSAPANTVSADFRLLFGVGSTTGCTASFDDASAIALPGKASDPSPTNGAANVSVTADLSWTAGSNTTSHDVYFGANPTPGAGEFQGNQAGTTFDPGIMVVDTTYYWRIDEKNDDGTTTGDVWSFTVPTVMEWVSNFPAIAISNITAKNSTPSASQSAELHTNGNVDITADNTTTAQLSNGTDTLVTEYKLEFDGDGVSATGGSEVDWTAYNTFLNSAVVVTYYSGDEYVNVTLHARASNAAGDVADAGDYSAMQTLTVSWVGP